MAKALGFGGVFLKARDPKTLSNWYAEQLGIETEVPGALVFVGQMSYGKTIFSHFPQDTSYFGDSGQAAMLNFRVDDLDALLIRLAEAGVRIDDHREEYSYGKFAWIWDPEDNRVELWQPSPED
jgi:predicted enzyme related to lactoylglutathione lyase